MFPTFCRNKQAAFNRNEPISDNLYRFFPVLSLFPFLSRYTYFYRALLTHIHTPICQFAHTFLELQTYCFPILQFCSRTDVAPAVTFFKVACSAAPHHTFTTAPFFLLDDRASFLPPVSQISSLNQQCSILLSNSYRFNCMALCLLNVCLLPEKYCAEFGGSPACDDDHLPST